MGIKIEKKVLGSFGTNTYLICREGENEAVVIDPASDGKLIFDWLNAKGLKCKAILLTHGHFDHIGGVEELKSLCKDLKVYASILEKDFLQNEKDNLSTQFGYPISLVCDEYVEDGVVLDIASIQFKMLSTPGHTVGGMAIYVEEAKSVFAGDTLFAESVGRTDFPTGSMGTLIMSIKEKLFTLPADTKVYPGHGENTSIGYEKDYNPYF